MKTRIKTLLAIMFVFAAVAASHAQLLFSDDFDYANGCIETDGVWFVSETYTAGVTNFDALVNDHLLILNQANNDSVGATFTNNEAPSVVYASFTINVSTLPTAKGGFFCVFNDGTNADDVAHIFIDTQNTVVPGTYQIGVANVATSITTSGATNFPMDLATDVTYQVVFSWDEVNGLGATLWINPSSENDANVYASDVPSTTYLKTEPVSEIALSQYPNQGVAAIGDVLVGVNFTDVMTNTVQLPVIGVQPQGNTGTLYSGASYSLYTAASGIDVTYQWYSNDVALADNGVTVVGSQNNVLNLTNLQSSAPYKVVATDNAGSVTSAVAMVSIDTTPTVPYFTSVPPPNQTNIIGQAVTLNVAATGTGPISYQWYFVASGSSITNTLTGIIGTSYSFTAEYSNSGAYFVSASSSAGNTNSAVFNVVVVYPTLVSIGSLHSYLVKSNLLVYAAGEQEFYIEGVVTTIGQIGYSATSKDALYYVQDGTGGCAVFNENGSSNNPPAGALVSIVTPAESYDGELEMDPYLGGTVTIISSNNPVPAPQPLNLSLMASNPFSAYGSNIQCSVVSLTNVYLSTSKTVYTAPTANFPTNGTTTLYAWPANTASPGQTNLTVYVYTYTNAANQLNTNYWGKPIPSFCYELTGAMGVYNITTPEFYPSRYADFVSTKPATFPVSVALTNGVPTISWPTVVGSTYSIYSATNLLGPWTQTFGLSYYPSTGTYTDTNAAAGAEFYRVSTP